jgi:hypothetical protein
MSRDRIGYDGSSRDKRKGEWMVAKGVGRGEEKRSYAYKPIIYHKSMMNYNRDDTAYTIWFATQRWLSFL